MRNNNAKSAAMNAKMYGFNQETFSNIQTIKAFDLIHFYIERLKSLQKEYIQMRMDFQKMSMLTSILMTLIGFIVSYSCYGWGIYRVWNNDHVPLPVRDSDKLCQFACRPCSVCSFPDDLCRPSDGYCGNAAGGLQP